MLFKSLYGDDVFISYSRQDGALYAAGVADKLTQRKLSCFIDKLGVEPNHALPLSLVKKIQNCKVFVLIGTEGASTSGFVAQEIEEFKKTGRTILPIDFNGAVGRARWYELIPGLATEAEKDPAALETGNPSPNVIGFIEKSFNYTRRNQRMLRMFWGALSVFLALVVLSIVFMFIAKYQVAKAAAAEQLARQRDEEAQASQQRADAAALRAEQMQKRADDATEEARKKQEEADRATRLAEEQTLLAQKAEGKARAAEGRQRTAEARATEQEQIAISREDAAASLSLLQVDPEVSLRLAESALGHAYTEQAENAFRGAFFESHVQAVIPGPFTGFGNKAFDSTGQLGLLGSSDGKVRIIEVRTGRIVRELTAPPASAGAASSPARSGNNGAQVTNVEPTLTGATFSPAGDYVAATDGSLEGSGGVYLWEWNNTAPHDRPRLLLGSVPVGVQMALCSFRCRILSIAFSPDGKYLAGAGEGGVVWVWETATGEQKYLMPEHKSAINQVSFSPDGRYILSAGEDGNAILWAWNPERGATGARTLPHEDRPVGLAVFSPGKGEYVVTTSESHVQGPTFSRIEAGEAWVWETSTGRLITRLAGHTGIITGVEFSPDGKFIATASSDSTARIWDWQSETMRTHPAILGGHTDGLSGVHFSPGDGKYVLTSSRDNTARLWKHETGRVAAESAQMSINVPSLSVLRGHAADVNGATFGPDGKIILTVGSDQTARVWRAEGEQIVASLPKHAFNIKSAAFSPDASLIVTTTVGRQQAQVWDWRAQANSEPLAKLGAPGGRDFGHAVFSPDGNFIAASIDRAAGTASAPESVVAVWERTNEKENSSPVIFGGCGNIINSVAFSHDPEGRYIVAAGGVAKSARTGEPVIPNANTVCIWDRKDAARRDQPVSLKSEEAGQTQYTGTAWNASFSYDNKYVVAATSGTRATGGLVLVWEWQSGEGQLHPLVLKSITGGSFSDAVFSPDGKHIAAAGGGQSIAMIWELKPREGWVNSLVLRGHADLVSAVAFSPDGKLVLTSSRDGTERLWSMSTGGSLATISGHAGPSNAASFSRDGRLILTTDDKTARVYSCEKCAPVGDLKKLVRGYTLIH